MNESQDEIQVLIRGFKIKNQLISLKFNLKNLLPTKKSEKKSPCSTMAKGLPVNKGSMYHFLAHTTTNTASPFNTGLV